MDLGGLWRSTAILKLLDSAQGVDVVPGALFPQEGGYLVVYARLPVGIEEGGLEFHGSLVTLLVAVDDFQPLPVDQPLREVRGSLTLTIGRMPGRQEIGTGANKVGGEARTHQLGNSLGLFLALQEGTTTLVDVFSGATGAGFFSHVRVSELSKL